MFDDLIVELDPPPNRQGKCTGGAKEAGIEIALVDELGQVVDITP